jgi:phosphonate transport system ATP-binding protein
VARVLYQAPDLLLADEPVSSLDPVLAEQVIQLLLAQARGTNSTLVCSLHAVNLALQFFPRVIGLRDGRIVFDCARGEVTAAMLHELYAGELQNPDVSNWISAA